MKKITVSIILILLCVSLCACAPESTPSDGSYQSVTKNEKYASLLQSELPAEGEEIAVIQTNFGSLYVRFFADKAPKAVENFKGLSRKGYYNDTLSHRIITDFMMQAGDPTATGHGGESLWGTMFEDEFSPDLHMIRGAVCMANAGSNTNTSQFFIVQGGKSFDLKNYWTSQYYSYLKQSYEISEADALMYASQYASEYIGQTYGDKADLITAAYSDLGGTPWLQNRHTIFGQVFRGLDVLDRIMEAAGTESGTPATTVRIIDITIKPYEGE